jgi:hypothetical protein
MLDAICMAVYFHIDGKPDFPGALEFVMEKFWWCVWGTVPFT